jgi:hypothetical protein
MLNVFFFNTTEENSQHLFFGCAIVNIIWSATLNWANMAQLTPSTNSVFRIWWEQASGRSQGREKKIQHNCDAYSVDYLARMKWSCFQKCTQYNTSDHGANKD